jgi:hypothetical protein
MAAEEKAHSLYGHYVQQVRLAYSFTLAFFIAFFIVGGALLGVGIFLVILHSESTFLRLFDIAIFLCGIAILLMLIVKNPTHHVMQYLSRMVEVDVIYTGFLRQIQQTDIAFLKQLSLVDHPTEEELAAVSKRMQSIINDSVNLLGLTLNDLG